MSVKTKFYGANLTYFIIIVGFVLMRILSAVGALDFLGDWAGYILSLILQIGLMLLLPIFLFSAFTNQKPKQTLKSFGLKKIKWSAVGISFVIGILIFFLNIGISSFFQFLISIFGFEKFPSATTAAYPTYLLFVNLAFTALLPAVCEEITHRGMLTSSYHSLGYKKAILFSALLFGLTHLNIEQFFYAAIIGAFLGLLTVMTGNIIPAMIVHFVNNAINVFLSFALARSVQFASAYNAFFAALHTENFLIVVSIMFFILCLMLLAIGYLLITLIKQTAIKNLNDVALEQTKLQLRAELMEEPLAPIQLTEEHIPIRVGVGPSKFLNIYVSADTLGVPLKQQYFPTFNEKIYFVASLVLTLTITLSTFIWGIL